MKVYITSDLHLGVDPRGDKAVQRLARFAAEQGMPDDVLVLAGDLATDDERLIQCLRLFKEFPGKKTAIAGNHDVWVQPNTITSLERYSRLPRLFLQAGFHPLEEAPFIQKGVGFSGAMGWYDYSFRDPYLNIPWQRYVDKPGWADRAFVQWQQTDQEVVERQLRQLQGQLNWLSGKVEQAVVIMHHVPTAKLLAFPHMRWIIPERWRYLNAFLGSERFQELLSRYQQLVRTVVCGHIHLGHDVHVNGQHYLSVGSTYYDKQLLVMEDGRIRRVRFTA